MPPTALQQVLHAFWHGFSAAMIAGCTAAATVVTASKRMPVDWEWLVIGSGMVLGFINGVNSFATDSTK